MQLNKNVLHKAGEWWRQQKPQYQALRRDRGRRASETVLEVGAGPGPEGLKGFGSGGSTSDGIRVLVTRRWASGQQQQQQQPLGACL